MQRYRCDTNLILLSTLSAVTGRKLTPGFHSPVAQSPGTCRCFTSSQPSCPQQEPAEKLTAGLGLSPPPQCPTQEGLDKASSILNATETQPHELLLRPPSSPATHPGGNSSAPSHSPFFSVSLFHSIYILHLPAPLFSLINR